MDFLHLLKQRKLVIFDGAIGSQLMARGLPAGTPGELWNLERPEVVEAIQREYVEAGAHCVLTNTFAANAVALARHHLEGKLEEIVAAAVKTARRAAGGKALVVGNFGPTGSLLEPLGDLTRQEAHRAYAAQARAFAEAGVDAFIAETFDSSEELRVALGAAREASDAPLIASMKFNPEPGGAYHSMMGQAPKDLVAAAHQLGCAAVGTNCGHGIATMVALTARIADLTDLPVIVQPNAGMPKLTEGKTVYGDDASTFAQHLPALYQAGARIIGGCCGTTAGHIKAIRAFADALD